MIELTELVVVMVMVMVMMMVTPAGSGSSCKFSVYQNLHCVPSNRGRLVWNSCERCKAFHKLLQLNGIIVQWHNYVFWIFASNLPCEVLLQTISFIHILNIAHSNFKKHRCWVLEIGGKRDL